MSSEESGQGWRVTLSIALIGALRRRPCGQLSRVDDPGRGPYLRRVEGNLQP